MCRNTHELSEVTYDVVGGQKQKQPIPTNTGGVPDETGEYAVIGEESKETFNLAPCPAYGPITQSKVGGVEEMGVYEVVSDM